MCVLCREPEDQLDHLDYLELLDKMLVASMCVILCRVVVYRVLMVPMVTQVKMADQEIL